MGIRDLFGRREEQRSMADIDWYIGLLQEAFSFGGVGYPVLLNQTLVGTNGEESGSAGGASSALFKTNPIIFGCMEARRRAFCQVRFQWQNISMGRPGKLFGNADLALLENPWANGFTSDLLSRMIQDADLEGNFFGYKVTSDRLFRMRPDWTTIVAGSERAGAQPGDPDVQVIGYLYKPGGRGSSRPAVRMLVEEVAHFAPIPDPEAQFAGMSWLTPVVREVMADNATSLHKLKFFENGATPNMVVKLDAQNISKFKEYVELFRKDHEGAGNAYRTLFLAGGSDATVVGANFEQMDFKVVQGAGEVRIAMAAGVQPIIGGLVEGLDAATFSNYGQARRAFADMTIRPLWQAASESLSVLVKAPQTSTRLWYDDRDVPFLQEDQKDRATVLQQQSAALASLIINGWDPDAAIAAITADDLTVLKGQHTGMLSVQLHTPGETPPANQNANGNGAVPAPPAAP